MFAQLNRIAFASLPAIAILVLSGCQSGNPFSAKHEAEPNQELISKYQELRKELDSSRVIRPKVHSYTSADAEQSNFLSDKSYYGPVEPAETYQSRNTIGAGNSHR